MDIIEKLLDLQKQASIERSHYYVASCVTEAIQEITDLRKNIDIVLNPRLWPNELDEKWHRAIPDLYLAFEELRNFITQR